MNASEAGRAFLAEVLAQVPADQQAAARAALEASDAALQTLGAGYLRQSDYSRQLDALATQRAQVEAWHGQLSTWHQDNQAKLEEYERIKANPATPNPATPANPSNPIQTPATGTALTREDLLRELQTREAAAVGAIVATNMLSAQHFKEFGEVLDIGALMRDPKITELGLEGVYRTTFKDRYDAKAKEADDKRIQAEVDRRLAEARNQHPHPYPVSGREPHFLDALETPQAPTPAAGAAPGATPTPAMSVVDAAVAEYNRLSAARLGSPA